ncbi:MAG TPA: M48 family metalloprotease [Flavobacterium sp.]|nr:M48 family metalloprotease [Flavobacterium sp.]
MIRSKILLLLLLLSGTFCFSQKSSKPQYQPDNIDSLKNFLSAITVKRNKVFANDKHFKDIQTIIENNKKYFIEEIKDSSYVFDKHINNYLKSILREIYRANPVINPADFYFFFDKTPYPNAASHGNGIFVVNLGLFEWQNSDDEVAFTICHEMAHQMLDHSNKSIRSHVAMANSGETRKKINHALRSRYGKARAVTDVVKGYVYNLQNKSRAVEAQADSLGFVFFNKTKYNKAAAASSLESLAKSDTDFYLTDPQLQKHFNFDDYPFREAWLSPNETLFDLKEAAVDNTWDRDSLKSHPDIPLRVETLRKLYAGKNTAVTSSQLSDIKKWVAREEITISLDNDRYDLALYQVLALSEKNSIDPQTYCSTVAYILKRTYELKANHTFMKCVPYLTTFVEEKNYNQVLLFLHNLELKNIRKIGYYFCQKNESSAKDDAAFADAFTFFKNLNPPNQNKN